MNRTVCNCSFGIGIMNKDKRHDMILVGPINGGFAAVASR